MRETLKQLRSIVGNDGFITDLSTAETLLNDQRGLYVGHAAAIVQPRTTAELAKAVRLCVDAGIGVVPQGGNTGYCGGATPDESGTEVLFNLSRMARVIEIDKDGFSMTAQAGVTLAAAQQAAAKHQLLLPLSMGSEASCQLGGNVSTNAGGLAVLRYGTTRELVIGLEVVLPDGRVWSDMKGLRKDNTGYDLKQLFIGAEGSLGIISTVQLRLYPMPNSRITAWLSISNLAAAVTILGLLRKELGDCITSFEYISREALAMVVRSIPGCRNPIDTTEDHHALVELSAFGDDAALNVEFEQVLMGGIEQGVIGDAVIAQTEEQRLAFWKLREMIPSAEKQLGGSVKHDVSIPISELCSYTEDASIAMKASFPNCGLSIYGHVGDGNLHFNVLPPEHEESDVYLRGNSVAISDLIHSMATGRNGSFSAEHGIGKLKRDTLEKLGDPVGLELMRQIKATIDPRGLMNPGKVL
ncbi:MAG TPA: hydroxyacid dehydrogenase [Gammaproteobacteria bacterium]|nr:hydroxyacid dehydrogenase [Gammaproteobacteria bacterium]